MAVVIADLLEAISKEATTANEKIVGRIQDAVMALIVRYAPLAPEPVKDQALVMCVGYIVDSPAASPGRQNFGYSMQSSGAHSLLAPFRVHRAGVYGFGARIIQ